MVKTAVLLVRAVFAVIPCYIKAVSPLCKTSLYKEGQISILSVKEDVGLSSRLLRLAGNERFLLSPVSGSPLLL